MSKKALTVQVLIATMNQSDYAKLPCSLNLSTNAIIGNQCTEIVPDKNFVHTCYKGNDILWLNFQEKGVGLNRNNALMRATADIIIFADDDMTFYDNYEATVVRLYIENSDADIIIFNIGEETPKRHRTKKIHYTKKCGYGCARITCRRESVMKHGVFFNLGYGGGTIYSHGEDSLFLADCVGKGLKVLVVPEEIAKLQEQRASTWFAGFTDKLYYDNGNLMAAMRVSFPLLRILKGCLKGKFSQKSIRIAKLQYRGYRDFKKNNRQNVFEK